MDKVDLNNVTCAVTSETAADEQAFARWVLQVEAQAIAQIEIGPTFHQAVQIVLDATRPGRSGSIVVSGLGKSGLIGQKISATFASTGTPSHFLHPTEAMHGDLGRVRRGDVVLFLSFGGNTDEVVALATILRQDQINTIAFVGQSHSDLARLVSVCLSIGDVMEACPLNLAPTASTTAMLALGDALALVVSRRRDFGVKDFKKFHPGGLLGHQLTLITDAMRFHVGRNLPLIKPGATIEQAFVETEAAQPGPRRAGAFLIVENDGTLSGIFTDGDLRRTLFKQRKETWDRPISDFMTPNPRRLPHTALVRDAVQMMREYRIDEIPVVDSENKPLGLIDVQDLVALKVIAG